MVILVDIHSDLKYNFFRLGFWSCLILPQISGFSKPEILFWGGMSALDKYNKTGRDQPERDFNAHALRLESVGLFLFLDCLSATAPLLHSLFLITKSRIFSQGIHKFLVIFCGSKGI